MKRYSFYLENSKWYVSMPEWLGDKEDLEMVCGADTMLDIISQGQASASVVISEEPFEGYTNHLKLVDESNGAGDYILMSEFSSFEVWLCSVVKFVYGKIPNNLYLR